MRERERSVSVPEWYGCAHVGMRLRRVPFKGGSVLLRHIYICTYVRTYACIYIHVHTYACIYSTTENVAGGQTESFQNIGGANVYMMY